MRERERGIRNRKSSGLRSGGRRRWKEKNGMIGVVASLPLQSSGAQILDSEARRTPRDHAGIKSRARRGELLRWVECACFDSFFLPFSFFESAKVAVVGFADLGCSSLSLADLGALSFERQPALPICPASGSLVFEFTSQFAPGFSHEHSVSFLRPASPAQTCRFSGQRGALGKASDRKRAGRLRDDRRERFERSLELPLSLGGRGSWRLPESHLASFPHL